jgi:hypothetical protein
LTIRVSRLLFRSQTFHPDRQRRDEIFTHSVRKDLTGFAIAAFIDWKLIVRNATSMASKTAAKNIHQLMSTRYA